MIEYVVTDPCYILPDDMWDECCQSLDDGFEAFNEAVAKALTKFTGHKAWASDTGYGDWNNEIYGGCIIKSDFYADAGMVCVCRWTASVMRQWQAKYGTTKISGAAIFEMSEDIDVDFDQSCPDWTVITIKDKVYGDVIQSMSANDYIDI